ncbi:MAG: hypothetical protein KatS3mg004_1467 [Bryobacteraceae bacterium]|nr:MAG: hypothetical protein KatS3mg004_1467 [Bryobacteraceae bacterium]
MKAEIAIYPVIHAEPRRPGPAPILEFSSGGPVIGQDEARLPEPGEDGRIPLGARVPADGWPASQYHVRLLLMEAGRPVGDERLSFVIE